MRTVAVPPIRGTALLARRTVGALPVALDIGVHSKLEPLIAPVPRIDTATSCPMLRISPVAHAGHTHGGVLALEGLFFSV